MFELRAGAGGATLFYAGAFLYALMALSNRRRYARSVLIGLIGVGFALQTAGLYGRGMEVRACPVGNPFEVLQFITWSLILLYLLTGPTFRMSLMGFFAVGLAVLLSAVALAVAPAWDAIPRRPMIGGDPWIEAHASLAIFSYGIFALLAVSSIMYLVQHVSLRRKQGQSVFGFLPSIHELEQMNVRLLMTSVAVYTVAIALGWVYWGRNLDEVSPLKLGFAMSLWSGYTVALVLRMLRRLHTHRFAWCCVGLFLFALLTLLPVELNRDGAPLRSAEPHVEG